MDGLEEEWDDLLQSSSSRNIFLGWDWMKSWWLTYGHGFELYLVEARARNGLLVALAPLRIARRPFGVRIAEFLGQGGGVTPEYLDFPVRNGWEDVALPALFEHLAADSCLAGLDLRTLPTGSRIPRAIEETLGRSWRVCERVESECPVLNLPSSWKQFLSGKSRNYRKKIREFENRCERELDLRFRRSTSQDELEADLDSLARLHGARWGRKSRAFRDAEYIAFHREFARRLLARDALRLYVMEDAGRPISVLYCFRDQGTLYYYQSGRDPAYSRYRVGLVIIHWAIREAIGEGLTRFDLLTGTEKYKQRWATHYARNHRIVCMRRGTIGPWLDAPGRIWRRVCAAVR